MTPQIPVDAFIVIHSARENQSLPMPCFVPPIYCVVAVFNPNVVLWMTHGDRPIQRRFVLFFLVKPDRGVDVNCEIVRSLIVASALLPPCETQVEQQVAIDVMSPPLAYIIIKDFVRLVFIHYPMLAKRGKQRNKSVPEFWWSVASPDRAEIHIKLINVAVVHYVHGGPTDDYQWFLQKVCGFSFLVSEKKFPLALTAFLKMLRCRVLSAFSFVHRYRF